MTKILSIETSTKNCSICLSKDGQPWIVRETKSPTGHAEKITLFIQEIMNTASLSLANLDAIAISKGPGSYTGLRIGVSTVKGLCYALEKPMIAVDSLQGLAAGARAMNPSPNTAFVALIDARRMEVYSSLFDKS